jgi:hypothetical protein
MLGCDISAKKKQKYIAPKAHHIATKTVERSRTRQRRVGGASFFVAKRFFCLLFLSRQKK